MSESVVFELKLQIQHLEEKLTFLAGGANGAELVEVLMEKDEELERNVRHYQCVASSRVDGRRSSLHAKSFATSDY